MLPGVRSTSDFPLFPVDKQYDPEKVQPEPASLIELPPPLLPEPHDSHD
jgi:hypothetical protein